jgi:hypothetical protein
VYTGKLCACGCFVVRVVLVVVVVVVIIMVAQQCLLHCCCCCSGGAVVVVIVMALPRYIIVVVLLCCTSVSSFAVAFLCRIASCLLCVRGAGGGAVLCAPCNVERNAPMHPSRVGFVPLVLYFWCCGVAVPRCCCVVVLRLR